mgnify:CR=1 FL=1|jgi:hypothetical protein|tara:strand:+ start:5782 stop:6324 length:543 start_codon:yes stop_codon:yes gene_type:complete
MTKKIIIGIIVIIVAGVGYYAISPLFQNVVVDDPLPSGFEDLTEEKQEEMLKEMDEVKPMPLMDDEEIVQEPESDEESVSEIFPVMGTVGHSASGHVRLLNTAAGTVLRYENFSTINGPRLHLYLAKDLKAKEFIDLGPIKGTEGNINYTIPEGVDVSEYRYVMYWCVPFSVLFNYAEIN